MRGLDASATRTSYTRPVGADDSGRPCAVPTPGFAAANLQPGCGLGAGV